MVISFLLTSESKTSSGVNTRSVSSSDNSRRNFRSSLEILTVVAVDRISLGISTVIVLLGFEFKFSGESENKRVPKSPCFSAEEQGMGEQPQSECYRITVPDFVTASNMCQSCQAKPHWVSYKGRMWSVQMGFDAA